MAQLEGHVPGREVGGAGQREEREQQALEVGGAGRREERAQPWWLADTAPRALRAPEVGGASRWDECAQPWLRADPAPKPLRQSTRINPTLPYLCSIHVK